MIKTISILFTISCVAHNFIFTKAIVGNPNNIRDVGENEFQPVACVAQYTVEQATNFSIRCSGVFITRTHVLTAEHCLYDLLEAPVEVLHSPSGDLSRSTTSYTIWWLSFDHWAAILRRPVVTEYNDLAVLKVLGMPITIPPVQLSSVTPIGLLAGESISMLGCGIGNDGLYSNRIQVGRVQMLYNAECERRVSALARENSPIPENLICTSAYPFVQMNTGDIGGPLYHQNSLFGVNAAVTPPMGNRFNRKKVNLHIAMDYYRDFIFDITVGDY